MSEVPKFDGEVGKHPYVILFQLYGPYVLSLVILLSIWAFIVSPQLDQRLVDYQQTQILVDKIREISLQQSASTLSTEKTAETLKITTQVVDRLVLTLDKIVTELKTDREKVYATPPK